MKLDLFTVLVEHGGGTYIGQVSADSPLSAIRLWLAQQDDDNLKLWQIDRDEMQAQLKSDFAVPLDGMVNVWCTTRIHGKSLMLINIVKTAWKIA